MGKRFKSKKKKKNKLFKKIYKYRRLIVLIILIIIFVILCMNIFSENSSGFSNIISEYENIEDTETTEEKSINIAKEIEEEEDNTIVGQTLILDADGYTTTFSTLNTIYPKTYIEYKQNLGSWASNSYWGGTMEENGCGITSIAIIASGYGSTLTPENLREKYYPHLEAEDIVYSFNKLGIVCTEFHFDKSYLSTEYITEWLQSGRPILVCLNSSEENIWTEASHYMAFLDINENGEIYVSNPNGLDGTEKASGWYEPDEVIPYIAKALFVKSYE